MSVLTIIPARSGSKRLPGKNWEKVGGKTLLQRALDCAPVSRYPTVIVTDAPELCPTTERGQPVAVFSEPQQLACDDATMADMVKWACSKWDESRGEQVNGVLLLQPTSPLRTYDDVCSCLDIDAEMRGQLGSVVSVTYDLATKGYRRNGAIYLTRLELAARGELMGGWTQFYVMPPERSIDINTAEDLAEARRLAGDA